MIELSIQIKNSETSLTDRHLDYAGITMHPDDAKLRELMEATKTKFLAASDLSDKEIDIIVRSKMILKETLS